MTPTTVYAEAARLAHESKGHYLDQFTYAERATDWRGNNNIAESIFDQMALERFAVPTWIVVGAGTGGTSATIGRYLRYRRYPTRLAVVDPEHSAFFAGWRDDDAAALGRPSRIEGIGRPRVEPSFVPGVVDRMIAVPDAASIATARAVEAVSAAGSDRRPARTCGARCASRARWTWRASTAASSRCSATAATGTRTPATTTAGWPNKASTSRRTPACSPASSIASTQG